MHAKVLISRNTAELWLTVVVAFAFVSLYTSSPVVVTCIALAGIAAVVFLVKYPEYGVIFLAVIFPFKFLNVKFVSIIGLNRLVIWGLLGYVFIRQFTHHQLIFSRPLRRFSKAAAIFILALVVSGIQTVVELYSTQYITPSMLKTTFFADMLTVIESTLIVYIVFSFLQTSRQIERLIETMLLVSAIIAFLGILQYYLGEPPFFASFLFDPEYRFYGRATSVFSGPNNLGAFTAPMVGVGITCLFWGQMSNLTKGFFLVPIIFVDSYALFLSFSRAAIIQLLLGIALAGMIYFLKIQRMKLSWKVFGVILVISGVFFIAFQYYDVYLRTRAMSCGARDYQAAVLWVKESKDALRLHAAFSASKTFLKHPFIGIGYNLFSAKGSAGFEHFGLAVHNQYLEILAEMGLLGFVPFITLLGITMRAGTEIWDTQRSVPVDNDGQILMLILLTGFSAIALGYLFSDSLSFIMITGYLWIFGGAILALNQLYIRSE